MASGQVSVAVIGAGDIGRGWAALCVAQGWPVTVYDNNSPRMSEAPEEIAERARRLVSLERAESQNVETGIASLQVARSLLQACEEAQWIMECIHEDLIAKQKLFEAIEGVAPKARALTSSSTGLEAKDIAARCQHPERCMVTHPLNPPELIPLVEVVPGPDTDLALLEVVKAWLRALGRIPVLLRKSVKGNVAGRISAAVWREAIHLVLEGVIDVDDLDRAVSVGPGVGWAAAGPHLTYHLAAGERGVSGFLQQLLATFENTWDDLADWSKLELDQQQKLIHLIERAYRENLEVIRPARDRRLASILRGLERARQQPRD